MILLLGGTAETSALATALAETGHDVLVSTATSLPLDLGTHPRVRRRSGRLDADALTALVRDSGIRVVADATHPYAVGIRETARRVAQRCGLPYVTLVRPPGLAEAPDVVAVDDHEAAARVACSFGAPVLLTTGSRNLTVYVKAARERGVKLVARVLDCEESAQACQAAGLDESLVIFGRGPFSVQDNLAALRGHAIGVLVTKDGGAPGGVEAKLAAARQCGAVVVLVRRPEPPGGGTACSSIDEMVRAVGMAAHRGPLLLAMDLESVLVPEFWPAVADRYHIDDLRRTTRDERDYDALMRDRLRIAQARGLRLRDLQRAIDALEPLPGALEFLRWTRKHFPVTIVSDTFWELAARVLDELGSPLLLCHSLEVNADGFAVGWRPRCPQHKPAAVRAFRELGYAVAAVGDSHNDVAMLQAADFPLFFRPPAGLAECVPGARVAKTHGELKEILAQASAPG